MLSFRRGLPPATPLLLLSPGSGEWDRDEVWLDAARNESRLCGESYPLIYESAEASYVWERK